MNLPDLSSREEFVQDSVILQTAPVVERDGLDLISNNCGTGAGGFQPGNTCAAGGGGGITSAVHPKLQKTTVVDTSGWPAHNGAAQWGVKKIALMEKLATEGKWLELKAMDTVPKSAVPNKYQKGVHEAHKILLLGLEGKQKAAAGDLFGKGVVTASGVVGTVVAQKTDGTIGVIPDGTDAFSTVWVSKDSVTEIVSKSASEPESKQQYQSPIGVGFKFEDGGKTAEVVADKGGTWEVKWSDGVTSHIAKNPIEQAESKNKHETPAKAAEPTTKSMLKEDTVDVSGWKKVGNQLGSNPGGTYEDESGKKWYVKDSKSGAHAMNEVLAAKLYEAAGAPVLDYKIASFGDGTIGTATEWKEKELFNPNSAADKSAAREHFATHAWLANWDAVGMSNDNQAWIKTDDESQGLTTLDTGGALLYRAQGTPKGDDFGSKANEWDSLRDPKISPQASAVFGGMESEELVKSAARVEAVSNETIHKLVHEYAPGGEQDKNELYEKIVARKNDIIAKANALKANIPVSTQPESSAVSHEPKTPGSSHGGTPPAIPDPPVVNTTTNPSAQAKFNQIFEAAKTGNVAAVEAVKTNPETKNTYGKKAHEYKQQVLAAMNGGAKLSPEQIAAASAAKAIEKPAMFVKPKINLHDLPAEPEFISKNAANVAQNKEHLKFLKEVALKGDLETLKKQPTFPSAKVNQFKESLISVLEDKFAPHPLPPKVFDGTIKSLHDSSPKVVDIKKAEKVGAFVVAGNPGVPINIPQPKANPTGWFQPSPSMVNASKKEFDKLGTGEQDLIKKYTNSGYQMYNSEFRQGMPSSDALKLKAALIKAAQPIPQGSLLVRKIIIQESLGNQLMKSVGKVLQEPAVMSTGKWHGNLTMNLTAGEGVRGLFVNNGISSHTSEHETILPPDTRVLVTNFKKKENQWIMDALILPTH